MRFDERIRCTDIKEFFYSRLPSRGHPIFSLSVFELEDIWKPEIWTFIKLTPFFSISNRNVVSLLTWESKGKINLFFLFSFTLDLGACSGSSIFFKEFYSIVSPAAWTLLSYNHIFTGSHTNNCVEQPLSHDYPAMIICGFVSHFLKLDHSGISPPRVMLCELQLHH